MLPLNNSPLKDQEELRWYEITRNGGAFQVQYTPNAKSLIAGKVEAIYAFKKEAVTPTHSTVADAGISPAERILVGMTHRNAGVRGREHLSQSRRKRLRPKTLQSDLQALCNNSVNPEGRFKFAVVKAYPNGTPDGVLLENKENEAIEKYDTVNNGWNKNKGRGGGLTRDEYLRRKRQRTGQAPTPSLPMRTFPSHKGGGLMEPAKWFRCSREDAGVVKLRLPAAVAQFSFEVIYVWRTRHDDKRLYGYTGQQAVAERVSGYFKGHSHKVLLEELRRNPDNVEFAVVEVVGADSDPGDRERAYIKAYKTSNPEYGYNRNAGGGGSRRMIRPNTMRMPRGGSQLPLRKYTIITIL